MRRTFVSLLGALLLLIVGAIPAGALQDASPESGLADLGLPELSVNVTTSAFEGIPESVEAGRYLVLVTAAADTEFGGAVAFVQPAGMTADDFLGALSGPPADAGAGAVVGTPIGEIEASPADGDAMGGPPSFMFEATYAGGTFAIAGESADVVVDLGPGEWIAWGDDPGAPQEPVIFEVTGEMPADPAEPESGATITMGEGEYGIEVTEGELVAGSQVVKVENIGAQPHFIFIGKGPDGMTEEQIGVALDEEAQAGMTGTPPAYSDLNPDEEVMPVGFTATQSTNTAQWITLDLEPGAYALVCFYPDLGDGMPHAFKGMYTVVDVEE